MCRSPQPGSVGGSSDELNLNPHPAPMRWNKVSTLRGKASWHSLLPDSCPHPLLTVGLNKLGADLYSPLGETEMLGVSDWLSLRKS